MFSLLRDENMAPQFKTMPPSQTESLFQLLKSWREKFTPFPSRVRVFDSTRDAPILTSPPHLSCGHLLPEGRRGSYNEYVGSSLRNSVDRHVHLFHKELTIRVLELHVEFHLVADC